MVGSLPSPPPDRPPDVVLPAPRSPRLAGCRWDPLPPCHPLLSPEPTVVPHTPCALLHHTRTLHAPHTTPNSPSREHRSSFHHLHAIEVLRNEREGWGLPSGADVGSPPVALSVVLQLSRRTKRLSCAGECPDVALRRHQAGSRSSALGNSARNPRRPPGFSRDILTRRSALGRKSVI